MTASTPTPAGVLTVDDKPNNRGDHRVYFSDSGEFFTSVTAKERARLLSSPRPDGVPDDAALAEARKFAEHWRDRWNEHVAGFKLPGRPHLLPWEVEPPYQPTPPEPEPADHEPIHPKGWGCRACDRYWDSFGPAPERTGPLGLSDEFPQLALLETRDRVREVAVVTDDELAVWPMTSLRPLVEACRVAKARWAAEDAAPAETLADIVAEMRDRRSSFDDWEYDGSEVRAWADRIEAAARPNPDTITVELPAGVARWLSDYTADEKYPGYLGVIGTKARDALAAAGLSVPSEDTER